MRMLRRSWKRYAATISLVAFSVAAWGEQLLPDPRAVAEEGAANVQLRIGGYPEVLQQHDTKELDAMINFKAFIESGFMGAEVTMFDKGADATAAFNAGALDGIFLTSVDYFAIAEQVDEEHIYSLTWDGEPSQTYTLLTQRKKRSVKRVADLSGQELTLAIGTSLAALILQAETKASRDPLRLKRVRRVRNSETAIVDLMFGKTDAVLVPTLAYEGMIKSNPQAGKTLKRVFVSEPYVPGVFVLHSQLPEPIRNQAVSSFMNMHNHEAGRHILDLFHAKKVVRVRAEQLSNVRTLVATR